MPLTVRKQSVYITVIRLLSSPHALEAKASLFAIIYGMTLAFIAKSLLFFSRSHGRVDFDEYAVGFGLVVFVLGVVGLYGLITRRRIYRMASAVCLSFCWAWVALFYMLTMPPLSIGVGVYGLSALTEVWVFLRVRHGLDYWR